MVQYGWEHPSKVKYLNIRCKFYCVFLCLVSNVSSHVSDKICMENLQLARCNYLITEMQISRLPTCRSLCLCRKNNAHFSYEVGPTFLYRKRLCRLCMYYRIRRSCEQEKSLRVDCKIIILLLICCRNTATELYL